MRPHGKTKLGFFPLPVPEATRILHDRERFSHELTLVFANGKTQILTHEKKETE